MFGSLYRRLKSRLDKAQATVATAHAIARVVYRMLKYKVEYEAINVKEYEAKYKEQQIKYMKKKAQSWASNSSLPESEGATYQKGVTAYATPALH
ncbi:MAG: hypothetical protein HS124_06885 [Anaerolineales bacterium]|nr:hypothetical protein [Anaerolineales bacterium]